MVWVLAVASGFVTDFYGVTSVVWARGKFVGWNNRLGSCQLLVDDWKCFGRAWVSWYLFRCNRLDGAVVKNHFSFIFHNIFL